jgi:hypothetical protein
MSDSWSNIEVELIVADYFNMLSSELKGEAYSKAEHRRAFFRYWPIVLRDQLNLSTKTLVLF